MLTSLFSWILDVNCKTSFIKMARQQQQQHKLPKTRRLRLLSIFGLVLFFSSFFLTYTHCMELSEGAQLALESSGELLPPAFLTQKFEDDLAAIRSQFPALLHFHHVPKWPAGELVVFDEKGDAIKSLSSSSIYKPTIIWQTAPSRYFLSFEKPYNPEVLAGVLRSQLGNTAIAAPNHPLGKQQQSSSLSSIFITPIPQSSDFKYLFVKGRGDCEVQGQCDYKRFWLASVNSESGVETLFASWGAPPNVSEAEQIALESGELLPSPQRVLRIQKDLTAIKSQFPEVAGFRHIPQLIPGELMLVDYEGKYLSKLNSTKFGPVLGTFDAMPRPESLVGAEEVDSNKEQGRRQTLIVSFSQPYNPKTLKEALRAEVGELPIDLNNKLKVDESAISLVSANVTSGLYAYEFRRNWSKCPGALCASWKFTVDAEGGVEPGDGVSNNNKGGGGGNSPGDDEDDDEDAEEAEVPVPTSTKN